MRRLMLLRHAKTERDAPTGNDIDRRLDERGEKDAAEIGACLNKHHYIPDLALISTAVRADQTWWLMTSALPLTKAVYLPELYGADPGDLIRIIHGASAENPQNLMIIAHNPSLHELALMLVGDGDPAARRALADNFPTSAVAVIDFSTEDWRDISFRQGRLELFTSPKLLKSF